MKKLLVLFFMGLLIGNAFAEEPPRSEMPGYADQKAQPESTPPLPEQRIPGDPRAAKDKEASPEVAPARPENHERNTARFIDIKVPNTADAASATVTEVLAYRGAWVQAGAVVAILAVGEKEVYVTSPNTGVIMKVLVKQGDSVLRGAALIQLKRVDIQRPDFQLSWKIFSLVNVSVNTVGKRIGGKVKQNIDIPEKEKGKWTNACTIRMSLILNNTGFPIKPGKYSTVSGKMGGVYIHRVDEMISYLRDIFGEPDIVVNHIPRPNDFSSMKGILIVTGRGGGDANGHVTLWDGSTCADTCHLAGDEKNITFTPLKAALWVLP